MIFVVDIVKVPLEAPCNKDKALCELAGQANGERYRFFPRLLAVDPQPVQEWGAVIALPPWTSNGSIVLMNLLDWDGEVLCVGPSGSFHQGPSLEGGTPSRIHEGRGFPISRLQSSA